MLSTPEPGGHPAHQRREFTITARSAGNNAKTVRVVAQTEHDAVLRAGMLIASQFRGIDPGQWITTSIHDPASR